MKIGQYCQRQRCKHVELEQFWQAFATRGFVSDSWAFLFSFESNLDSNRPYATQAVTQPKRTAGVPYSLLQADNMLTTSIVNVCDERE